MGKLRPGCSNSGSQWPQPLLFITSFPAWVLEGSLVSGRTGLPVRQVCWHLFHSGRHCLLTLALGRTLKTKSRCGRRHPRWAPRAAPRLPQQLLPSSSPPLCLMHTQSAAFSGSCSLPSPLFAFWRFLHLLSASAPGNDPLHLSLAFHASSSLCSLLG